MTATATASSKSVLKFLRGLDISGIELKSDESNRPETGDEQAVGDDETTCMNLWPSTKPLEAMNRLQWLKLRNVGLHDDQVPDELFHLNKLEHLSMAHNSLTSITKLQDWPRKFPDLRVLNLRKNKIASPDAIPRDLFECPNLQVIDLSRNQLKAVPRGIENASSLLVLNLADNRIGQIPPDLFVNCKELMFLDLSGNTLEALPAQLRRCCALQKLYLSRNPLRHAQLRAVTALKQLEILSLSETERRLDNFPAELSRLDKLKELELAMNQLTKIPDPVIELRNLRKLDLSHNELEDLSNITDNWPQLEYLNLSHNLLTLLPSGLVRLTSLRKLYLNDNHLTFSGIPSSIGKLSLLEVFNASNNCLENIPEGLCRCGHLKRLYLNSNCLVTLPDAIHFLVETLETFEHENNPHLKFPPKPAEMKKGAGLAFYNIDFSLDAQMRQMRGMKQSESSDLRGQAKDTAARLRRLRKRRNDGDSSMVLEGMKRVAKEKDELLKRRDAEAEEEAKQIAARRWQDALSRPNLDYSQIFEEDTGALPGIEMWEMDEFYPKRIDDDPLNGRLFDGDCYIVLETKDEAQIQENQANNSPWLIYYWIGSRASLDKRACAAMHAVNLRNFLGAEGRTIREEQDDESAEFLALFDSPIMVIEGSRGETGFLHVEEKEVIVKLYRLFGKEKTLHIVSMPVHVLSLDPKFVYLLDGQSRIYVWIGALSRLIVQTKGRLIAEKIATKERRGDATICMERQGRESNEFWTVILGLWKPPPCPPTDGVADASDISKKIILGGNELADLGAQRMREHELLTRNYPKPPVIESFPDQPMDHISVDWKLPKPILYDVKLGKGFLEIPQVDLFQQGLTRKLLKPRNVYLLDSGGELFVWIGDKAPKFLRYAGCKLAHELTELMPRGCFGGAELWLQQFREQNSLVKNVLIDQSFMLYKRPPPQICVQSAESQIFRAQFSDWESAMAVDFTRTAESVARRGVDLEQIVDKDKMKVDLRALLTPRELALPPDEAMRLMAEWNDELLDGPFNFEQLTEELKSGTAPTQPSLGGKSLQQFIMIGRKWLPVEARYFGHFFAQDSFIVIARSWEFEDEEEEGEQLNKPEQKEEDSDVDTDNKPGEANSTSETSETNTARSRTVVYFWQGRETSDLSWITFNLSLRKDMESLLSHNAEDPTKPLSVTFKHIRQQQEDAVFLAYFQRQLVIHRGKYRDRASKDFKDSIQMYHMRANGNPIMTRSIQITPNCNVLNSCFSYLLRVPAETVIGWSPAAAYGNKDLVYIWIGERAHADDEALLESIAMRLFPKTEAEVFVTPEGRENSVFWRALGGQKNYDRSAEFMDHCRLFRLSNEQGYFSANEKCSDFCQDDLADEHVMLLDTGQQIFLWLGKRTSDVEVKLSLQACKLYKDFCTQSQANMPRSMKLTAKNAEVHSFKRCFHGWGPYREPKDWSG